MREFDILANAMRSQAEARSTGFAQPRIATISSYNPATHEVKVAYPPDNVLSGWMPLGAIGIGNGWGLAVGPQIGDQVFVVFDGGEFDAPVIVARLFSVAQQPPAVPSGETWIVHKSGSYLKFLTDGEVLLNTAGNLTATVAGQANLTASGKVVAQASEFDLTGNVVLAGNLTASGTVTGTTDVVGGGKSLKTHVHSGVQAGASNTGQPV